MTVHELAQLFLRRWYIFGIVLGLLLVFVLAFGKGSQVYSMTAEVNFAAPAQLPSTRQYVDNTETLIDFAGAVVGVYSSRHHNIVLSSPNASMFGNGVRTGSSVSLFSSGSQWKVSFNRPTVIVHVAGTDERQVSSQVRRIVDQLSGITRELQFEAGVKEAAYITSAADLDVVNVYSFGQTRTGKYKGSLVLLIVGFFTATFVADALDRRLSSRRVRVRPNLSPAVQTLHNSQPPSQR